MTRDRWLSGLCGASRAQSAGAASEPATTLGARLADSARRKACARDAEAVTTLVGPFARDGSIALGLGRRETRRRSRVESDGEMLAFDPTDKNRKRLGGSKPGSESNTHCRRLRIWDRHETSRCRGRRSYPRPPACRIDEIGRLRNRTGSGLRRRQDHAAPDGRARPPVKLFVEPPYTAHGGEQPGTLLYNDRKE